MSVAKFRWTICIYLTMGGSERKFSHFTEGFSRASDKSIRLRPGTQVTDYTGGISSVI